MKNLLKSILRVSLYFGNHYFRSRPTYGDPVPSVTRSTVHVPLLLPHRVSLRRGRLPSRTRRSVRGALPRLSVFLHIRGTSSAVSSTLGMPFHWSRMSV